MASPVIKIRRSSVQNNAPTAAQLELGELALNTYDGKLFTEINDGTVSIVEIGGHLQHLAVSGISTLSSIHGNINSTGISTISGFRFPSTDGSEDQALVTDGSGSLSFKTLSGSSVGGATTISSGITTATQGQTVFSLSLIHI